MIIDSKNKILYSASLLYQSFIKGEDTIKEGIWEETIILLLAQSISEAENKANLIGKQEEMMYENSNNEQCQWVFSGIQKIYEIQDDKIGDGSEIFSRFLRKEEAISLLTPFEENDIDE